MVRTRIVIADDHALMREGVRALLQKADDIEVVGEAEDGRQAIDRCKELEPDVILLDIAMPNLGGLEAALEIRKVCPRTKIIVLTQYEDREYVSRFLKIGVSGYILKKAAGAELASAIRGVVRGGLVLAPEVARVALEEREAASEGVESVDSYETLTDREKQVLKLVAEGRSNKEVAELLSIGVKTAMSHREHVMGKLGVHGRTELIRFALRRGIIQA